MSQILQLMIVKSNSNYDNCPMLAQQSYVRFSFILILFFGLQVNKPEMSTPRTFIYWHEHIFIWRTHTLYTQNVFYKPFFVYYNFVYNISPNTSNVRSRIQRHAHGQLKLSLDTVLKTADSCRSGYLERDSDCFYNAWEREE